MLRNAINRAIAGANWNPRDGLIGSSQGVWYDPSDTTTLFQDAAGTTPVTAMEQPIGKMLDKSGRGNHAFNASGNSANFPVLSARYNLYVNTETLATQNVTTVATSYKLTFTGSGSITLTGTATGVYTAGSYTISCAAGTLTSTVLGTVTQADLRVANDALNQPAYQRVNTPSDYDTVGFKPYLRFNGANQWLQTNSIDFSYGDKMFVSAGVRKLSDAVQAVYELSALYVSNSGAFASFINGGGASTNTIDAALKGSGVNTYFSCSAYGTPISYVHSVSYNIAGTSRAEEIIPRINGVLNQSGGGGATDTGTGNFGNYPLYIGARAGTSVFFNGRLYQMVVAGKQASADQIVRTEQFVNSKTKAYT